MGTGRKTAGLRPLKAKITKALPVGAYLNVADNSGARLAQIIAVRGYHGKRRRLATAGIGDIVTVVIKEGEEGMRHKVVKAVIIRQKKEIRRPNGLRVKFEDNACVILKDEKKGEPQATMIKGPVAREVVERFPLIGKIALMVA
ncbi:MAG: 50S ribosomal protein L14 [Candidatus Nanoarchaeia archaeon]|nr:50S ribosomal protein L14 [Candidatus Haiyanarchaeum thermophilum]MCW1303109.1 50S ribosomal protein L14 [Candidatus Haiyanarchaeum thermophilum]MCW1303774.1 50S ribosomal protein L14 [Candidatus Haiyanarchaeum thermophilum]MCW1306611.1 50S ribosomal protein L14 [Candidatus Haiyanarchaeum thermophilum]MCW1307023.1 50S ribosomal protein L14 [Candidatus Haiyanarchaeum thermophilum]